MEVIWSKTPTNWSNGELLFRNRPIYVLTLFTDYLISLFTNNWTLVKSPAGGHQFEALESKLEYPDPFNETFRHATMLVADLALREDPTFSAIAESWVEDFQALTDAFAAAWCKSSVLLAFY